MVKKSATIETDIQSQEFHSNKEGTIVSEVTVEDVTQTDADAPTEVAFDVSALNPMELGLFNGFRNTVGEYLSLKEKVSKKSENDFDAEAKEILTDSPAYKSLTEQIEELTNRRKEIYQEIREGIKADYEKNAIVDPATEQAFTNAKEMFTTGRSFLKLHFPGLFNEVAREYKLTQRENAPRKIRTDADGNALDSEGKTRRIRKFTFVVGGISFENATKCSQFLGVELTDFQKEFFATQGTDDSKQFRSIVFEVGGKSVEANKLVK